MPQPITPSTSQLGQPARTRFRARKEGQDSVQHAQADADDLRAASTSYTTTDHGVDAPKPKDAPETGLPTVEVAQPLPDHPQLCILTTRLSPLSATADGTLSGRSTGSAHVEYRVYNWRRLPSGRIIRGDGAGLGSWAVLAVIGYLLWGLMRMHGGNETGGRWQISSMGGMGYTKLVLLIGLALLWLRLSTTRVVYQSVTPLPNLGIQLSTTRGTSIPTSTMTSPGRLLLPLSTSRTFIPLEDISTVIINEGLTRWNVRYYLGIVSKGGRGVDVAYDQLCQPVAVLKEVYHGLREALYDEYADHDAHGKVERTHGDDQHVHSNRHDELQCYARGA